MSKPTLSEMVKALIAGGTAGRVIAERCGCDISTVWRIREQKITDPRHSVASAIESLYRERITDKAA